MSGGDDASLSELLGERRHLLNIAYRMLGTTADAEDVVQETYARWYRLSDEDRAAIAAPRGWLVTVASRICLDQLGSARARRERYIGEWLPEPLPEAAISSSSFSVDPLDRVSLDDSVTMALLVVLDSLSPAERVAFVLHDVFSLPFDEIASIVGRTPVAVRKLASTARRHVAERRERESSPTDHRRVVEAFWSAARAGEFDRLIALLDPDVETRSDGGGKVRAATRAIFGADRTARFLLGVFTKMADYVPSLETVAGRTGLVLRRDGVVGAVVGFDVVDEVIRDVWIVVNPDKLTAWNRV